MRRLADLILVSYHWCQSNLSFRAVLKNSELVVDTKMKDAVHLYFPRHEGGLSSPIDIVLPLSPSEDKMALSTFMFTFVERIQTLGMFAEAISVLSHLFQDIDSHFLSHAVETKLTASEASHAAAAKKAEISSPTKKVRLHFDPALVLFFLVLLTNSRCSLLTMIQECKHWALLEPLVPHQRRERKEVRKKLTAAVYSILVPRSTCHPIVAH